MSNKSQQISAQEFDGFWDRVKKDSKTANAIQKRARFCAVMGHISFFLVLGAWGFLFPLCLSGEMGFVRLPWYSALGDKIYSFLIIDDSPIVLLNALIFLAPLVVIPFVVCAVCALFFPLIHGRECRVPPEAERTQVNLKNAKTMLSKVDTALYNARYTSWDDFYPMHIFNENDIVEINAYNFIPILVFFVSGMLSGFLGHQATDVKYYGFLALALLMCELLFILIIVPMWKLSSITNSLFYRKSKGVYLYDIEDKLKAYIKANTPPEKPKTKPTSQSSGGYSYSPTYGDRSWSAEKGLNTYYTDGRNGQTVYYKDGEYVNDDGERVPIQWMVE